MIGDHWFPLVAVLALIGANECTASAQDWTEHEVTVAKIAVNEATFHEADAIAIASARGRYSVDELRAMHPRALSTTRTDSRRWIADLAADAHRPEGWPEHLVPWSRGRELWLSVLSTVRATIRGERRCSGGVPSIWGGPRVDRARLDRMIADGWVVVACGPVANVYLRRGGR